MSKRIADETELIQTYLAPLAVPGAFGLIDDAALIAVPPGDELVVTTDPVVAGVHFFPDDAPRDVAWKAIAVNVSDLIAKGARPMGYTLALALGEAPSTDWMAEFSAGLAEAQAAFGCGLLGGDTDRTAGPLSVGVTAFGIVPRGRFIRRTTARIGDQVFVTGPIGDAALGLRMRREASSFAGGVRQEHRTALIRRYLRPQPNVAFIDVLRRFATSALDISDGLVQDVARLARGADAALVITAAAIPLSAAAQSVVAADPTALAAIVTGGDDYHVLFSIDPADGDKLRGATVGLGLTVYRLGVLEHGKGVTVLDGAGVALPLQTAGYDHFQR